MTDRKERAPMAGIFSDVPLDWEKKAPGRAAGGAGGLEPLREFVDIPFKEGDIERFREALLEYGSGHRRLIFEAPAFAQNMNVRYQGDKWRMSSYPAGARFQFLGTEPAKLTPYNFVFKPLNESTEPYRDSSDGRVVINLKKILATLTVQRRFVDFLGPKEMPEPEKKETGKGAAEPEISLSELARERKERALCRF